MPGRMYYRLIERLLPDRDRRAKIDPTQTFAVHCPTVEMWPFANRFIQSSRCQPTFSASSQKSAHFDLTQSDQPRWMFESLIGPGLSTLACKSMDACTGVGARCVSGWTGTQKAAAWPCHEACLSWPSPLGSDEPGTSCRAPEAHHAGCYPLARRTSRLSRCRGLDLARWTGLPALWGKVPPWPPQWAKQFDWHLEMLSLPKAFLGEARHDLSQQPHSAPCLVAGALPADVERPTPEFAKARANSRHLHPDGLSSEGQNRRRARGGGRPCRYSASGGLAIFRNPGPAARVLVSAETRAGDLSGTLRAFPGRSRQSCCPVQRCGFLSGSSALVVAIFANGPATLRVNRGAAARIEPVRRSPATDRMLATRRGQALVSLRGRADIGKSRRLGKKCDGHVGLVLSWVRGETLRKAREQFIH
ncbi:hypothetical protein BIWAKO_05872 [Bosea sp. BIWAKO-01]|nr:hypothetical protein BIWAKO_05872 [Bosea sp. BIWAKO-01]